MRSSCKSISVITYDEFTSLMSEHSTSSVVLQIDSDSYLFIDIGKLIREQPMSIVSDDQTIQVTSWSLLQTYLDHLESDIFRRYLTTSIVPRYWEIPIKTSDSKFKENKTYFTRTGNSFIEITYEAGSDIPSDKTYYEYSQSEKQHELTPFFSNIGTQLRIRSVENTIGLDAEYCNHDSPYERRNLHSNVYAPDIAIINKGLRDTINFKNTIPVINGAVFYSSLFNNAVTGNSELIAHEAGKWLINCDWNQANVKTSKHKQIPNTVEIRHDNKTLIHSIGTLMDEYKGGDAPTESAYCYNKSIILIDFSTLGNIEIIKLSDCLNGHVEYGYNNTYTDDIPDVPDKKQDIHRAYLKGSVTRPYCSYYNIEFDLPSGTTSGIPIVCICGRLFYLKEDSSIRISEDKITLSVKIERELFHRMILTNLQGFGKQIHGTGFVEEHAELTLNELFKDTPIGSGSPEDVKRYLYEDTMIPFVIMLHTDKKLVCTKTRPIMTLGPDKFLFPPYAGGLLINKRTREIIDYVRQYYGSYTLVETSMLRPINYINKDYKQIVAPALAFEFNKYKSRSKYKHFDTYDEGRDLDEYMLLDFAYTEN